MSDAHRNWLPTPENINALPEPIRRYIHDLETRCDPARDVAALTIAQDHVRQLAASNRILRDRAALLDEDAAGRPVAELLRAAVRAFHCANMDGPLADCLTLKADEIDRCDERLDDMRHALELDQQEAKFQNVYCSQCGREFGPGDQGYSSCSDHRMRDPRLSQPKCHSCGGFVKLEEGGICLPCHTDSDRQ